MNVKGCTTAAIFLLFFSMCEVRAQNPENLFGHDFYFMENKGQVVDQYGKGRDDVKYIYVGQNGFRVVFTEKGFSYEIATADKPIKKSNEYQYNAGRYLDSFLDAPVELSNRRIDIDFVNPSPSLSLFSDEKNAFYLNYYKEYLPDGTAHIPTFKKIIYRNVWPGIDLFFMPLDQG
jgi:hypothetical protein